MLYESARDTLKQKGLHGESIRLSQLKKERKALEEQRIDMSVNLESQQSEYNDLLIAKKNVEMIMSEDQDNEKDKSRSKESEIE